MKKLEKNLGKNSATIKRWLPAIAVATLIFLLSSLNGDQVEGAGLGQETYQINAHFFLYFMLCIALYRATKSLAAAVAIGIFYSLTDEFHQTFVPGRSFQIRDIVVDSVGILLAGLILWKYYLPLPKKLRNWLEK